MLPLTLLHPRWVVLAQHPEVSFMALSVNVFSRLAAQLFPLWAGKTGFFGAKQIELRFQLELSAGNSSCISLFLVLDFSDAPPTPPTTRRCGGGKMAEATVTESGLRLQEGNRT